MTMTSLAQCDDMILPIPDLNFQYTDECEAFGHETKDLEDLEFPSLSPKSFHDMIVTGEDIVQPVDSRYNYEFNGGHIINAANICKKMDIVDFFKYHLKSHRVLVFYCESTLDNRALTIMRAFRNFDRKINAGHYPQLHFPKMYLLEGGYKSFYTNFPEFCVNGFIPMRDQKFRKNGEIKRCHSLHRSDFNLNTFDDLNLESLCQIVIKDI